MFKIKNVRTTKETTTVDLEEFFKKDYFIKKNYEDFLNEKYGNINIPILGEVGVGTVVRKTNKNVFKSHYIEWVDEQYHYVADELMRNYNPVEFRDLIIEEIE